VTRPSEAGASATGTRATGTIADAYRECEAITKQQARNFYYGIRLLPAAKRDALCAVYAISRRIDDIGDGDLPLAEKTAALSSLRASLRTTPTSDAVLVALADAASRFPIPMGAFDELIDGVEMDLAGRTYQTFEELVTYCRCVAGSVGRLSLGVFGSRDDTVAPLYADQLGIALQQTNILRDIREDLTGGRVYLPQRELDEFGVQLALDEGGALADKEGNLARLIAFSAERARRWYADGWRLMPLLDRRSAASTGAMSGIYRRLLDRISADPTAVYTQRLSLSGREKAGVAVRALLGSNAGYAPSAPVASSAEAST
jgi:15-cis-phytoene synthase